MPKPVKPPKSPKKPKNLKQAKTSLAAARGRPAARSARRDTGGRQGALAATGNSKPGGGAATAADTTFARFTDVGKVRKMKV